MFQATHPQQPLRVYFMTFAHSVEQQKNSAALRWEKETFEQLIADKARLVLSANQDGM